MLAEPNDLLPSDQACNFELASHLSYRAGQGKHGILVGQPAGGPEIIRSRSASGCASLESALGPHPTVPLFSKFDSEQRFWRGQRGVPKQGILRNKPVRIDCPF